MHKCPGVYKGAILHINSKVHDNGSYRKREGKDGKAEDPPADKGGYGQILGRWEMNPSPPELRLATTEPSCLERAKVASPPRGARAPRQEEHGQEALSTGEHGPPHHPILGSPLPRPCTVHTPPGCTLPTRSSPHHARAGAQPLTCQPPQVPVPSRDVLASQEQAPGHSTLLHLAKAETTASLIFQPSSPSSSTDQAATWLQGSHASG